MRTLELPVSPRVRLDNGPRASSKNSQLVTVVYTARNTETAEMAPDAEGAVMNFAVQFLLKRAGLASQWAVSKDPLVRDFSDQRIQKSIANGDFHGDHDEAS